MHYSTVNGVVEKAGKKDGKALCVCVVLTFVFLLFPSLEVISAATAEGSSPSGTTPTPARKATQFASSAESSGAVINFKVGDTTTVNAAAATAVKEDKRKKGADYERVTHSHESTAASSSNFSSGSRLTDSYSADRNSAVPVIRGANRGDNSNDGKSAGVYSGDDQVDASNNPRHLSQSYAAVAAAAAATGDESDLRSPSRAPDTIISDLHSSPLLAQKNSKEDSRLPSQQRVDNRPKW